MPTDTTTFLLSFAAVFLGIGAYLWHLERKVNDLARRLQATSQKSGRGPGNT